MVETDLHGHERHWHGCEQLEESFHPGVDDPEAPVVDHGDMGVGAIEHGGQLKDRDGDGADQEERWELPLVRVLPHGRPQGPAHQEQPDNEAQGQQPLPEAAQTQVLAALEAESEPKVVQLVVDPQVFPAEAAEYHRGKGAHLDEVIPRLPSWIERNATRGPENNLSR